MTAEMMQAALAEKNADIARLKDRVRVLEEALLSRCGCRDECSSWEDEHEVECDCGWFELYESIQESRRSQ